jgi:hypothetical protein
VAKAAAMLAHGSFTMKKNLLDEYPFLFYWILPVAVLGFFYRPAWYGLAMVVGIGLVAGIVHLIQVAFKK